MDWDLKDLLAKHQIDPRTVPVLRHTPKGRLRKVFPWLAADHPVVFNAYRQTQSAEVEKRMKTASYVASFVGHELGHALFIGLYQRHGEDLRNPD